MLKIIMRDMKQNQDGLASIIIVSVIVTVVVVITLGFAGIVRREQRQALDQQLSAQARYAAESALNEKIAQYRTNPGSFANSTDCVNRPTFSGGSNEIQTTCVQVDTAPGPLQYDQIRTSESTMIWLDPGSTPLDRIVITWQNPRTVTTNNCVTDNYDRLPPSLTENQVGMLRFDLSRLGMPLAPFTRDSLRVSSFGGILSPKQSGTSGLTYTPGPIDQPVAFGTCGSVPAGVDDPYAAHAIINIPNDATLRLSRYILRLRGVYKGSMVQVVGFDAGGNVVEFADTQIALEATARVNDIVQRVHVRLPAGNPPRELIPDDAIHATAGVCKLLETEPGSTTDSCDFTNLPSSTPTPLTPGPEPEPDPPPFVWEPPPNWCVSGC